MAIPVTVPRLGWTMEQGVFVGWRKQNGDEVRPGELLFELEGDKAAQDIEALDAGILHVPADAPRAGETVAVGAVLGYLLAPGESAPEKAAAALTKGAGTDVAQVPDAGTTARVAAAVPPAAVQPGPAARPAASPRARRVARELGLEWQRLHGSGRTGRIRERDVRAAAARLTHPEVGSPTAPPAPGGRMLPLTPARRVIAERLLAGTHAAAAVTLTTRADATNLVSLREQFKAAAGAPGAVVPGFTDFLLKLTAAALREHPLLNAAWTEEGIRLWEKIDIAIAVDTEAGLVAPVVRDVAGLNLRQVAACSRELIKQARSRRLTAEQMQGGTFTMTNLGMYGVDAFTPLLNPPQCAVLGLGRIHREPVVVDERVVPRHVLTLSLTFDHRVVDGAPAARFLEAVRRSVEQPGPWLIA
jgi:pyruvate dehydrogenase E2 component (dihydrolipoamide acetyltransferase)